MSSGCCRAPFTKFELLRLLLWCEAWPFSREPSSMKLDSNELSMWLINASLVKFWLQRAHFAKFWKTGRKSYVFGGGFSTAVNAKIQNGSAPNATTPFLKFLTFCFSTSSHLMKKINSAPSLCSKFQKQLLYLNTYLKKGWYESYLFVKKCFSSSPKLSWVSHKSKSENG